MHLFTALHQLVQAIDLVSWNRTSSAMYAEIIVITNVIVLCIKDIGLYDSWCILLTSLLNEIF